MSGPLLWLDGWRWCTLLLLRVISCACCAFLRAALHACRPQHRLVSTPPFPAPFAAGAAGKDARDPPSVLRGAVVRYMSQGRHRLDLVAGTAVDAQGALALRLAAFCKLVPVACLSASSPLDDDAAWEGGGGKEVAELAQALASRLPTCSEVRWERWVVGRWLGLVAAAATVPSALGTITRGAMSAD